MGGGQLRVQGMGRVGQDAGHVGMIHGRASPRRDLPAAHSDVDQLPAGRHGAGDLQAGAVCVGGQRGRLLRRRTQHRDGAVGQVSGLLPQERLLVGDRSRRHEVLIVVALGILLRSR